MGDLFQLRGKGKEAKPQNHKYSNKKGWNIRDSSQRGDKKLSENCGRRILLSWRIVIRNKAGKERRGSVPEVALRLVL